MAPSYDPGTNWGPCRNGTSGCDAPYTCLNAGGPMGNRCLNTAQCTAVAKSQGTTAAMQCNHLFLPGTNWGPCRADSGCDAGYTCLDTGNGDTRCLTPAQCVAVATSQGTKPAMQCNHLFLPGTNWGACRAGGDCDAGYACLDSGNGDARCLSEAQCSQVASSQGTVAASRCAVGSSSSTPAAAKGGLGSGAVIGIAVGGAVLLLLLLVWVMQ